MKRIWRCILFCAAFVAGVILVSSFVGREQGMDENMSLTEVLEDAVDLSAAEAYLKEKMPAIRGMIEDLAMDLREPTASVGTIVRQATESEVVPDIYGPQNLYPKVLISVSKEEGELQCDLEFAGIAFTFTAETIQEP